MLVTASPALADGTTGDSTSGQVQTVAVQPASPVASCPGVPAQQYLTGLGDNAFYAPLAGGTFESGAPGWTLNNASVTSGNESYNVVASTDSNSLSIAPGGSAVSPTFCVDSTFPSWRFFALANGSGYHSGLNVAARWTLSNGYSGQVTVTNLSSSNYGSWQATPSLPLGSVLQPGQTVTVQFVFTAGSGAGWNIDDVLLDPYAK